MGYVSALDREGRTIWIADSHRDGKRFIVRADERLTAFVELESAIRFVHNAQRIAVRINKARQVVAASIKTLSITSPDVSTHLRPG